MGENLDQAKGRIKQAAGDLTDDQDLKDEGRMDELAGKAKEKLEGLKDTAAGAVDALKDKLQR